LGLSRTRRVYHSPGSFGGGRCGLTLIELVVTLAIIGILILLALPAIQRARAASMRLSCANHLRQIGIALQRYHDDFDLYPSAMPVTAQMDVNVAGGGFIYSPFVRLLPYLEQSALYNSINFVGGLFQEPFALTLNNTVVATRVGSYLCPADGASRIRRFGPCSYRINVGARCIGRSHPDVGAFEPWLWLSARDFSDGTSHTAGVSEKTIGQLDDSRFHAGSQWQYPVTAPFPQSRLLPDEARRICASANPNSHKVRDDGGATWFRNGFVHTWYNHVAEPNAPFLDCALHAPFQFDLVTIGVFGPRSYHPSGVNVMMMDGSVRSVSERVGIDIWRSVATRSGGETVPSF